MLVAVLILLCVNLHYTTQPKSIDTTYKRMETKDSLHFLELKEKDHEIQTLKDIIILRGDDDIKSDSIFTEYRNKFKNRQYNN